MKALFLTLFLSGSLSQSQTFTKTPLEGVWLRPCQQGGMQVQIFENTSNSADEIFFEDQACTKPLLSFLNDGEFLLHEQNIDFRFTKVSMALYTENIVADFNSRKVCGKSDWSKNSPTEITGLQCALFQENKKVQVPRAGEMRFGIWKVEKQNLFFGQLSKEQNGTTPEKRPTQWDIRPYRKQR